jgi:heat-inducible transcriptional repressor
MPAKAMQAELTPRQRDILGKLVEEYVATGQPVGSKHLVEQSRLGVSSSTVRYELAELEGLGFLTHPHTSAGRIPTERGYRLYVDELLQRLEPRPARFQLDLSMLRSEVESALQATTEALADLTSLPALVSAPPLEPATVHHVEVLLLQPEAVVVVVITSTGDVSKRIVAFDRPVDPGLVKWAAEYLNERVAGLGLGTHLLRRRFEDSGLAPAEREFLALLRPAFTELLRAEQRLYVGGTASLLEDVRAEELGVYRRLLEVLEKRAALLELVDAALDAKHPFVRVGGELEHPKLQDVALVAACYGLSNRALGTVGLLGPVRMDYDKAIRSVRSAAHELSRFVEAVYAEN